MNQVKTTLFAKNKDESYQEWKVSVSGGVVQVEFGKVGGKVQTKLTQCEPKNVGRSNETTAEDQALAEAISKWEKQVRLGYRETIHELDNEEVYSVMLAHDAIKRSHDIIYPCYVQPKLDGLRCLVTFDTTGTPVFNSRGNKTYPIQGNIVDQVKLLHDITQFPMLDGEVYLHGLSLQKISSLAKKWRTHADIEKEIQKDFENDAKRRDKAIKENKSTYLNFNKDELSVDVLPERDDNRYGGYESADLQFHIFDVPDKVKVWFVPDGYQENRLTDLEDLQMRVLIEDLSHIRVVQGEIFDDEESVKKQIAIHMQKGYEGDIVRNFKGRYEFGQRSSDLQKWKIFQSEECLVTDYVMDKNDEAVLTGVIKSGKKFSFKMKGTNRDRNESAAKRLLGKYVTFTFQTLTDGGIPQFPVGIAVREVNPLTWEPLN